MTGWYGSSPKTGETLDAPMKELVAQGHLERKDIIETIQHCNRVTQCIICGKKWGRYWLLNPEESDVEHVCEVCIKTYDFS